MFTDARGYLYKNDRARRAFYKALDAARVRQMVPYALRHTMATLVLHETKDLKLVATRLGYSKTKCSCCGRTATCCQAWTARLPIALARWSSGASTAVRSDRKG